jgi:uncharacterized membrane protein
VPHRPERDENDLVSINYTSGTTAIDLAGAAVASQANVGGATSALALAKSLGREDLLVPGILLGSLGTAVGTFLGFVAAGLS